MGQFKFKKNLELDIEGKVYQVNTSSHEVNAALQTLVEKTKAFQNKIETQEDMLAAEIQLNAISLEFIKTILGDEAYNYLLNTFNLDTADVMELANYICTEIHNFKNSKITDFMKGLS